MPATRSASGSVYLVASSQKKTLDAMIARAVGGLAGKRPRVAVSYAASGGPHAGEMTGFLQKAFAGAEVTRFTVKGEAKAMDRSEAEGIVREADVIFLGGGDPIHGAKVLAAAGADRWIRDARSRGAACMGVSAGAMMLCACWAEWPDDAAPGAPHGGGALVTCVGVVPDLVVDCHAEQDHWNELKLVRGMLQDRGGDVAMPRLLGLPTGGGVIVGADGALEPVGAPPFHLPPES